MQGYTQSVCCLLGRLCSRNALFEEGVFSSVPRVAGPASAEAERRLHSWGSQLDLVKGMEMGKSISSSLPTRSSTRSLGSKARSAVSSSRGEGSTLHLSSSSEVDVEGIDEDSPPQSPKYEELLEVVTRTVAKLNIDWPAEKQAEPQESKLDKRFLRSKPPPPCRSLPFFPDLHTKVSRLWARAFSSRLFNPASSHYANVAGVSDHGYRVMPRVEQTLASYLSPGAPLSSKAPALPSKPSSRHLTWHINCLEMLAVFRALKHFLPDLRDRHVLAVLGRLLWKCNRLQITSYPT